MSFGLHFLRPNQDQSSPLERFELQQVLLDLWQKNNITALMVTHDVDEAVFLSDRVAIMTNGPEADLGDLLEIDYPRPRDRKAFMEQPVYYEYREHLITYLNEKAHLRLLKHEAQNAPIVRAFQPSR